MPMEQLTAFLCGINVVFLALYVKDLKSRAILHEKLLMLYQNRPDLEKKMVELSDKVSSMSIRLDRK